MPNDCLSRMHEIQYIYIYIYIICIALNCISRLTCHEICICNMDMYVA